MINLRVNRQFFELKMLQKDYLLLMPEETKTNRNRIIGIGPR